MSANGLTYFQSKDKDSTEDLEEIQEAKPKLGNIPELTAECREHKQWSEIQLH